MLTYLFISLSPPETLVALPADREAHEFWLAQPAVARANATAKLAAAAVKDREAKLASRAAQAVFDNAHGLFTEAQERSDGLAVRRRLNHSAQALPLLLSLFFLLFELVYIEETKIIYSRP